MNALAAVERPLAIAAIAAAAAALAIHAIAGFDGAYLHHVSGVWLALAGDLAGGVFYRELAGEAGYGGTRYFPLFFSLIALVSKAGPSLVAAGHIVSVTSLVILGTGLYFIGHRTGRRPWASAAIAAAGVTPFFVQQTMFEIRADVLAAGCTMWGVGWALVALRERRHGAWIAAAAWFTAAFATKVTALAIPGAVGLVALMAGQRREAAVFGLAVGAGAALVFGLTQVASDGRALESWRACMFPGGDAWTTLQSALTGWLLPALRSSRLIQVFFVMTLVTLIVLVFVRPARPQPSPALGLAVALWIATGAATSVTLATPGAIPSNQVVEWIAVIVAAVAIGTAGRPLASRGVGVGVSVLVIGMAAQDVLHARAVFDAGSAQRAAIVDRIVSSPGPVLTESPFWSVLAGRHPEVLDPFSLRAVMATHPDVESDLIGRVERRAFDLIVLERDPRTFDGRGLYETMHLSVRVVDQILASYVVESEYDGVVVFRRPDSPIAR